VWPSHINICLCKRIEHPRGLVTWSEAHCGLNSVLGSLKFDVISVTLNIANSLRSSSVSTDSWASRDYMVYHLPTAMWAVRWVVVKCNSSFLLKFWRPISHAFIACDTRATLHSDCCWLFQMMLKFVVQQQLLTWSRGNVRGSTTTPRHQTVLWSVRCPFDHNNLLKTSSEIFFLYKSFTHEHFVSQYIYTECLPDFSGHLSKAGTHQLPLTNYLPTTVGHNIPHRQQGLYW
jgi:hypothetical protein